MAIKLLNFS